MLYTSNSIVMNKCIFVLSLFLFVSCIKEQDKGINAIKIENNSDDEIFVFYARSSFYDNPDFAPTKKSYAFSKGEYNLFLRDRLVLPHSYKYYNELRSMFTVIRGDTLFHMAVVNRLDFDTLSDEEFKSKLNIVIQYEYKVTPQYMINHDWTLVYPPESEEE